MILLVDLALKFSVLGLKTTKFHCQVIDVLALLMQLRLEVDHVLPANLTRAVLLPLGEATLSFLDFELGRRELVLN